MANIFENPRAPFIGRSPVPGPQTPPGQSFGNFYYGGTPRMNTMQRPRANSGGQAPMPTGYEYGAGISGGAGYETWGTPNNVQNNQGQANTGYTPDNIFNTGYESNNIFNTGGSVTPRPGGNGLSGAQNQEIMNNLPTPMPVGPELGQSIPEDIQTGPAPGGGTEQALLDIAGWSEFREPSRPESGGGQGFTGGLPGKLEGGDLRSRPNPAFEGIDMSGFKPPGVGSMDSRMYSINGVQQQGGSTYIAALRSYLDSIGQGDAFSETSSGSFSQPTPTVDMGSIRPLLPPGGTPNMPEGFTQGTGGRRIVPWTNSVTGETWNAPNEGYKPPSSDWQQDVGQKFTGGLPPLNGGKGGGGMYSGEQYAGLDMSGFNPRGQQTADMRAYTLNGKTYHGSSSWASQLQDYLNSTGQGDAFGRPEKSGFGKPGGIQTASSPSLKRNIFGT